MNPIVDHVYRVEGIALERPPVAESPQVFEGLYYVGRMVGLNPDGTIKPGPQIDVFYSPEKHAHVLFTVDTFEAEQAL